jgi:phosphopantetheinyl transferase (holo-ACP synthase)
VILGADITSVAAWEARLRRTPATAALAFSAAELRAAAGDPAPLAVAWALKESVAKSFGTGFAGVPWRAIELLATDGGAITMRAPFGRLARGGHAAGWRADVLAAGDRVVAGVLAAHGPVRSSSRLVVPPSCSSVRRERREQLSLAARVAARGAAGDLLGAGRTLDFAHTRHGAPLLRCRAGGPRLSVSLSRGSDAAIALVGVDEDGADGTLARAFAGCPVTVELAIDRTILDAIRGGPPPSSRASAAHTLHDPSRHER